MAVLERKLRNHIGKAEKVEKVVKNWKISAVEDMAEASEKCFNAFNELQMEIAKLKDFEKKKEFKLLSYKVIVSILDYIDSKGNSDFNILLYNGCKPFAKLIKHYNEFCAKIEEDYDIEIDIEKEIRNTPNLYKKIKNFLK